MSSNFTTPSQLYATLTAQETAERLHTSGEKGLGSHGDASYLRSVHGPNDLIQHDEQNLLLKFLKGFAEQPMNMLLLGSAGVSFFMGNWDDGLSITIALLIVVTVGFVQEYRSEKSLEKMSTLVPPCAHLVRAGHSSTVLASQLVPGDLVRFTSGDRVPADVRLVSSTDLDIDESNLTGEGEPVRKSLDKIEGGVGGIPERKCIGFMGTLVVNGRGTGVVVGTGIHTELGAIFSIMSSIDKPKTPLQQSMDRLSKDLSFVSFIVIALICFVGIVQGRKWLDMFTIGVSLAVAAIPEGLPIIVTVTLALGVLRMAKRQAIVRRLPSVETLGCVSVVCSDKTGTLTMNRMSITQVCMTGNSPTALDKTERNKLFDFMIRTGAMCNNANVSSDGKFIGHPTDVAFMDLMSKFKQPDPRDTGPRSAEVSFNSRIKWMGVTVDGTMYVKGACERILPKCSKYMAGDGTNVNMDEDQRNEMLKMADIMAGDGLRVLGLATGNGQVRDDVEGLCFVGLVGMADPPRQGVDKSIARLVSGGVKVIMITGDSEATAVAIGRQAGLPMLSVIRGDELDRLSPRDLEDVMSRTGIFARASPEHKMKIIKALQGRGDVVAMTGDGVNDAPALKMADIGVAMGVMGTDVAKEAADMVLMDDDFSTIVGAIEEGKSIFSNIQNFVTFQLSTSIAALALVMMATIFGLDNPLNAMQILWINILMDGPPAQSLGVEPVDMDVMQRPPRKKKTPIINRPLLMRVLMSATIIMCGTMCVFVLELGKGGVNARDTTMTFTCFVFFDMFNALGCRHASKSVRVIGLRNKVFNIAVGCSLLGQMAVVYVPFLQRIFQTEALYLTDLLILAALASTVFWADEFRKWRMHVAMSSRV